MPRHTSNLQTDEVTTKMKTLSCGLLILHFILSDIKAEPCSEVHLSNNASALQLAKYLTHPCLYNSNNLPPTTTSEGPFPVRARIYIYYLQKRRSTNVFKVQTLLQLHWRDIRLDFRQASNLSELNGQRGLLDRLWYPRVYIANEHESSIRGMIFSDQGVSVTPSGEVFYSLRLHSKLLCQTEEGKFPFDALTCQLLLDNWRYNKSAVGLQWEKEPVKLMSSSLSSLTEFDLTSVKTMTSEELVDISDFFNDNFEKSKSSLIVIFHFSRNFGFYFWDYYAPSVLLVVTSWGTFWVDPEVVPCRVWLATSTMLGFFGLGAMNKTLPKMSQLKMNDLWFIGCNLFIFLSLAEFALVNIVHRQETKHIPLKRASGKYILRTSLMTEQAPWRRRSSSCPSSPELRQQRKIALTAKRKQKSVAFELELKDLTKDERLRRHLSRRRQAFSGTLMTNKQMADWIDRRSRFIFPLAFVIFNLLFWTLMFLDRLFF